MTDWWQILAVIAIAAAAVWLWRRTGRPRRSCCDSNSSPSANSCANCPLTSHCPHNNPPKATLR